MKDFATIVHEAVDAACTEAKIREKVDARIEGLVEDVIRDQLRSYSDIGKAIETALKESLQVKNLDLPSYGEMVTTLLRKQIEAAVSPVIAGQLATDMEGILGLAPKEIKLSELVEWMMQNSSRYEDGEHGDLVTCIVGDNSYGSTWVYLDDREHYSKRDKYLCRARFLVSRDGTIFSGSCDDREIGDKTSTGKRTVGFGRPDELAQRLMAYHACGTVIELDVQNVSTFRDYD